MDANSNAAVNIVEEVKGVDTNDGAAVDTFERVEGLESAPVALIGYTEATCAMDPPPYPPAQSLEGCRMRDCCIVSRHWFDG